MTDCVCTIFFSVSRENGYQEEVYWREDDDSDPSVSSFPNESIKWFTSLCPDKEKITTRIYSLVLHGVLTDRCILHPRLCLQACQRAEDSTARLPWHHLRSLRYGGYCKDASCNVRTTLCQCCSKKPLLKTYAAETSQPSTAAGSLGSQCWILTHLSCRNVLNQY